MRICTAAGCGVIVDAGRCDSHRRQADRYRGTAAERGYNSAAHRRFRAAVLYRDPICVVCDVAVAVVADHWPRDRRVLVDLGLDPNDPQHGRGLCIPCHSSETAANQPGGWNLGAG